MPIRPLRSQFREATAAAILDAAEQVMASEGVAGAALSVIAKNAGIAVGTIYNHFADKEELVEALFARRRNELYTAIDSVGKQQARAPFEVQLEAFVRAVLAHFDTRRDFLRLALETEHTRPRVVRTKDGRKRSAIQQLQEHALRIVRVGLREKRLREQDAGLVASVLVALIKGVLVARYEDEESLSASTQPLVELFLHGAAR